MFQHKSLVWQYSIVKKSIKGWKGYQWIYPLHCYDALVFLLPKRFYLFIYLFMSSLWMSYTHIDQIYRTVMITKHLETFRRAPTNLPFTFCCSAFSGLLVWVYVFSCIYEVLTSFNIRNLRKDTDNSAQQKFCLDSQLLKILSTFQSSLLCSSGAIAIVHCSHLKQLSFLVYAINFF